MQLDHATDTGNFITHSFADDGEIALTKQSGYTDRMALQHIYNFYKNTKLSSPSAYRFCHALEGLMDIIENFPLKRAERGMVYTDKKRDPEGKVSRDEWDNIGKQLQKESMVPKGLEPEAGLLNIRHLANFLQLDTYSKDILELIYIADQNYMLRQFFEVVTREDMQRRGAAIARMMGRPQDFKEYARALETQKQLIGYGLLYFDPTEPEVLPPLHPMIANVISQEFYNPEEVAKTIIGKPVTSKLAYGDFEHLGKKLDFVKRRLEGAISNKTVGFNILLAGKAGGGKTELAKVLAQALDQKLFAVGEISDDEFSNPDTQTAQKRLGQLRQAQAFLRGSTGSILMFDEMEDTLKKGTDSTKTPDMENKVEFNRMLEENTVPTIWIVNDIGKFHESALQRFSIILNMNELPTLGRKKIWEHQCGKHNLDLAPSDVLKLARKYAPPIRMIAQAVQAAGEMQGGIREIEENLEHSSKGVYGMAEVIKVDAPVPDDFTPRCVNAGDDTEEKVKDLITRGTSGGAFSLFVQGVKGSGVGSLLRYIGEQLKMNVMERSMSELCQATQNATPEMRVTSAFERALDNNDLLVINDIEFLKYDPEGGSWESSLARTFLKLAQDHELPFAVTTTKKLKLSADLDFIFTDKYQVEALCEERANDAYQRFFGRVAPEKLSGCKGLLLGDFSAVAKLSKRFGATGFADERIIGLLQERLKREKSSGMGFRHQ